MSVATFSFSVPPGGVHARPAGWRRGLARWVGALGVAAVLAACGGGGGGGGETPPPVTPPPPPAATAPAIGSQPAALTVAAGQPASFSVTATGTAPLSYEWLRNGAPIASSNAATYTLAATTAADNGVQFSVRVSNAAGSVTSGNALLTVTPLGTAPTIPSVGQPANQTVTVGQVASFTVTATGTAPLSYQWRRGGANLAGATSATYSTAVTTLNDNGASFDVLVTNAAGSATSAAVTLTVQPLLASNYWLRGSAGVATAGTVAFANGAQPAARLNLTLVDPAAPGGPQVVEQPGAWTLQVVAREPRLNPQNPGDAVERLVVYARGTRLWRLDLSTAGAAPVPQQLSSASLSDLCADTGSATAVLGFFEDSVDPGNSLIQYRNPGADGVCQTVDDAFWAIRASATAATTPSVTPRILTSLRNANGAITGFLARSGNQVQRLDANLGGATNAFTVSAATIELLRTPSGPGLLVFRDGNALRAYDPASGAEPVTFATAESDFAQLGEVGAAPATALYRNGGRVVAYPLTTVGELRTVLTLATGQTVASGGGDTTQRLLILSSGSGSQLVSVGPIGAPTPFVTETAAIDAGRVGGTPSRWIYTLDNGRVLKSVPRAGGEAVTLASAADVRVANIGTWEHETVWLDRVGPGAGGLLGAQVSAITSTGAALRTLENAVTVGGASFNGFRDTSVGRIVATPINANADRPYGGASLLVLDPITGATRVTYGALANAAYNTVDVSGLAGPGRGVLVTASSVQVLTATTADLYFVRVGTTGLQRLTTFVP